MFQHPVTFLIFVLTTVAVTSAYKCIGNVSDFSLNRKMTGILFDPLITIEDYGNSSWYDDSGMKLLLQKIHTKFDQILVDFSIKTMIDSEIILDRPVRLPIIAAEINKANIEKNENTGLLKIVILYSDDFYESITDVMDIQEVINRANEMFPGTVKRIIFNPLYTIKHFLRPDWISKFISVFDGLEFGLLISMEDCSRWDEVVKAGISHKIRISLVGLNRYYDDILNLGRHQKKLENCKVLMQRDDPNLSIIFLVGVPDNSGDFRYSRVVEYFTEMSSWAKNTNTSVIFSKAFDTHAYLDPREGWWRVRPNGSYEHPSQFVFEEKVCLKDNLRDDKLLLSLDMTWLQKKLEFNSSSISLALNPFAFNKNLASSTCNTNCFKKIIAFLSINDIRRVYVYPFPNNLEDGGLWQTTLNFLLDAVASLNSEGHESIQINIVVKDRFIEMNSTENPVNKHFQGIQTAKGNSLHNLSIKFDEVKDLGFGYLVLLQACNEKWPRFYTAVEIALKYDLQLCLDASVDDTDRKLGFDVIFQEFKAYASLCKNHLRELNVTANIMFLTGLPSPTDLNHHYDFVRYWENVVEWAEQTKTNFILNSAFDNEEMGGWWKLGVSRSEIRAENFDLETQKESLYKRVVESKKMLENVTSLKAGLEKAWPYTIGVVGITCGIIIIIISAATYLVRKKKRVLSKHEIDEFFKGTEGTEGPNGNAYNRDFEIEKGSFTISNEILGTGSHGKVSIGKINWIGIVAVKIGSNEKGKVVGLLSEIKTIAYLGKHENIVKLVGASTCGLERGKVFVFFEFCSLGSLEKYLKAKGNEYNENLKRNEVELISNEFSLKLMRWSLEIGMGMEYIASKQIVHLDLATRNILLTIDEQVKISDFCLSQYLSGTYVVTNEDALPWRWMSPECFKNFAFNEKSDVWAFGVTLWEMFNWAELPYGGGQCFNEEFTTALSNGLRLGPPLYNRNGIYEVMKSCWHENPEERPAFTELKLVLGEIIEEEVKRQEASAEESVYDIL